jgi:hypothetical protein
VEGMKSKVTRNNFDVSAEKTDFGWSIVMGGKMQRE